MRQNHWFKSGLVLFVGLVNQMVQLLWLAFASLAGLHESGQEFSKKIHERCLFANVYDSDRQGKGKDCCTFLSLVYSLQCKQKVELGMRFPHHPTFLSWSRGGWQSAPFTSSHVWGFVCHFIVVQSDL